MLLAFFSWWYGEGWRRQASRAAARLSSWFDYFSFDLISRTLFSPFRQISAGPVRGPIGVQFRAWVDRTVSRFIGAMVRIVVLIAGIVTIIFTALVACLQLIIWPFLPAAPIVGLIMTLAGWLPWR